MALSRSGQHRQAIAVFEEARALAPTYLHAILNHGSTLYEMHRYREAVAAFREAFAIDPVSPVVLSNLGLALTLAGDADAAVIALQQSVRLDPHCSGAWSNLGLALAAQGDYPASESAHRRALGLNARSAEAHVNLGNMCKEAGRVAEALGEYDVARSLDPQTRSGEWNRSLALLQQGDFQQGWPAYESRLDRPTERPRLSAAPRWDGSDFVATESRSRGSILVQCEQGLGDSIQFIRYLPLLAQRGWDPLLEAPYPLATLLRRSPAVPRLIVEGEPLPSTDCCIPLMSLPHRLGTRLNSVPAEVPYLRADEERVAEVRRALPLGTLTVGVVWQGNPHHAWDRHRSIALSLLAPLASIPGVTLVSLQRGPGSEQALSAPFPITHVLLDGEHDEAASVANLAAAIAAVDLVISVDTLPAHLAGAMARPVWVLLSTMVDWRWLLDRSDSPWYPTMRLYRQTARGQWHPVIDSVRHDLQREAGRRSGVVS